MKVFSFTPEYCYFCERRRVQTVSPFVCGHCQSRLPFRLASAPLTFDKLDLLRPQNVAKEITCPFYYEGRVREALLRLKFAGDAAEAKALAPYMLRKLPMVEALIPVPLAKKREKERGYNQAARLAAELARLAQLPVVEGWLIRTRETAPQAQAKDVASRFKNVWQAFHLTSEVPPFKRVALVDDVFTTGATLLAAAKMLARSGVHVTAVVCAANQGKAKL